MQNKRAKMLGLQVEVKGCETLLEPGCEGSLYTAYTVESILGDRQHTWITRRRFRYGCDEHC